MHFYLTFLDVEILPNYIQFAPDYFFLSQYALLHRGGRDCHTSVKDPSKTASASLRTLTFEKPCCVSIETTCSFKKNSKSQILISNSRSTELHILNGEEE